MDLIRFEQSEVVNGLGEMDTASRFCYLNKAHVLFVKEHTYAGDKFALLELSEGTRLYTKLTVAEVLERLGAE